jgi:LacI family transcriptional regulator
MTPSRVTLREVADAAKVNPGTASRVLNPETRHLVKAETARRVDRAAAKLGYQPNRLARSLRTRRSHSIGVIIPDITNPLFPPIVRGIEDALAPLGYTALVTNADGDPELERERFETLRGRQVDGFILGTATVDDELISRALEEELPFVLVNRTLDVDGVHAVAPDDRRGSRQAIEHLVELGHRDIGHIAGPQSASTGQQRLAGFLEVTAHHGVAKDERAVVEARSFTKEAGAEAARTLLDRWPECTAIFASNDLIALGVYSVAKQRKLRCPDDLSVVGFNDMPFADSFSPPLTTVHIPLYDLGLSAGERLLDLIRGNGAAAGTTLLQTHLVVRGSTAPPASR